MKKNILLKVMILIVFSIVIVLTILLYILLNNKGNTENILENNQLSIQTEQNKRQIDDYKVFYIIEKSINYYFDNCEMLDTKNYEDEALTNDDKLKYVYNMLDEQYIKGKSITIDNIKEKIKTYKQDIQFKLKEIKKINENEISSYAIFGKIEKKETLEKIEDIYTIINIDLENKLFSIEPLYNKNVNSLKEISIQNANTQIKNNVDNMFGNIELNDYEIASEYFEDFKERMLLNKEDAYNILQADYRIKKYSTIQDFNKYIENINNYLKNMQIIKCSAEKLEEYTIYTCKDQYNNTYIFKKQPNTCYTTQLDDYTLENEAFNEKYAKVNDRDKGLLNVDKFFKMINMQDYTSAYAVLDNNFKQNYFKTQTDFENYMKNKVFRYNKVDYKEYSNKITNIYTYKVVLTDLTEENPNEVEFNIVMKLLEGTDFVMSFAVN